VTPQAFPIWVYLVVAVAIASIAFVIAQFAPGGGIFFVLAATTAWTAIAVRRQREMVRK